MRRVISLAMLGAALIPTLDAAASPEPGITIYHVGVDNRETLGHGRYTGLPNPNVGRLTFLLSHTFTDRAFINHFHTIGAYSYTGEVPADPNQLPELGFSTNNHVPEPYQQDDGLSLLAGSGAFAGKLISGLGPEARPWDEIEQEYGDTTIAPIDELFQYDNASDPDGEYDFHPGHYLLNASGGGFKDSVAGVTVGLKLVGLTPGLTIHDGSGGVVMDAVGESITLGPGADWSFEPVFAVDASTPVGSTFEATFILEDLSATPVYGDSAEFTFSLITAIPEPSTAMLGLTALVGLAARRR